MRNLLLATTLVFAGAGWTQPGPATTFDPTGKWTYATQDEQGSQVSGTMTITGKAPTYTGTITTGEGQAIPITQVLTSGDGMVLLASLPDGAVAMIRVTRKADGKFESAWSPVRNMIPATIDRAK